MSNIKLWLTVLGVAALGVWGGAALASAGALHADHTEPSHGCIYMENQGPGGGLAAIHWHGTTGWTYLGQDAKADDYRKRFAGACDIDAEWFSENYFYFIDSRTGDRKSYLSPVGVRRWWEQDREE